MSELELPDVKRYHLILVPVEGVHGGYVRHEDYGNLEIQAQVRDLRLTTALEDVSQLKFELKNAHSEISGLREERKHLWRSEAVSAKWLGIWSKVALLSLSACAILGLLMAGVK